MKEINKVFQTNIYDRYYLYYKDIIYNNFIDNNNICQN
jgi:hypothetical protein